MKVSQDFVRKSGWHGGEPTLKQLVLQPLAGGGVRRATASVRQAAGFLLNRVQWREGLRTELRASSLGKSRIAL